MNTPQYRSLFTSNTWKKDNECVSSSSNSQKRMILKEESNSTISTISTSANGTTAYNGSAPGGSMFVSKTIPSFNDIGAGLKAPPPPKASLIRSFPESTSHNIGRTSAMTAPRNKSEDESVPSNNPNNNWIIVSGFTPNQHGNSIQNRFQAYGVILDQIIGKSNWICLHYATPIEASKALCQNWTLHHNIHSNDHDDIFITVRKLCVNDLHLLRRKSCHNDLGFGGTTPSSFTSNALNEDSLVIATNKMKSQTTASTLLADDSILLSNIKNKRGSTVDTNQPQRANDENTNNNAGTVIEKTLYWAFSW